MKRFGIKVSVWVFLASLFANGCYGSEKSEQHKSKTRSFQFEYGASVKDFPAGSTVNVWIPVPPSNEYQKVDFAGWDVPGEVKITEEPKYGNRMIHFRTVAPLSGEIDFQVSYRVERREVKALMSKGEDKLSDDQKTLFLLPNAKVPVGGKPAELLANLMLPKEDPLRLAKTLYDRVDEHMTYDKSRPGYGRGDAVWACDSRFGNCTDFHSLFISLSRSLGLPARFVMGFPLPDDRGKGEIGGYHCWAYLFCRWERLGARGRIGGG